MGKSQRLPAVHLSVADLGDVESLLEDKTTDCSSEVILSFPGGTERQYNSVDEVDSEMLDKLDGTTSYSLVVNGEEGKCTITGESRGSESHMLYCEGDKSWANEVQLEIKKHLHSVQTTESRFREQLTGSKVTALAIFAALFVGWALPSIAPQPIVHYFPTPLDAFFFAVGIFGLSILRFRNWIHPYVWVGSSQTHPTKRRILHLVWWVFVMTTAILAVRWLTEPGVLLQ